MARTKLKKRKRWSLAAPDAIATPRNPNQLKVALGHLGPFQYDTQAEALANGRFIEKGIARLGVSRQFATELVEDTARNFNIESHLEHDAPRFKHLVGDLTKTQSLINGIVAHFNSLDDIVRHELQFAGASKEHQDQFAELMHAADAQGLPRKSTEISDGPCSWVLLLTSLSSYVGVTGANVLERRKRGSLGIKDVGGNTNLWTEEVGIPRWGLVNDALWIYELFKPGKSKATIGGNFYKFVHDLFEYATGRDATVDAKIDDWVKRLVKPHREDKEEEAKQKRLDVELEKLLDDGPETTKTTRARVLKIKKEMGEIATRREALAQIMFPHVRLKPRPV